MSEYNLTAEVGNICVKKFLGLASALIFQGLRRIVWDDLTDYVKQFSSGTKIVKEIEQLLMVA